jgi:hypothetical protein
MKNSRVLVFLIFFYALVLTVSVLISYTVFNYQYNLDIGFKLLTNEINLFTVLFLLLVVGLITFTTLRTKKQSILVHAVLFGLWTSFIIGSVLTGVCVGECYLPLLTPFVFFLLVTTFIIGLVIKSLLRIQSSRLRIIILIIPLVLIWGLAGVAVQHSITPSENSCKSANEGSSTRSQSHCYYELAIKNLDFSICFKIPSGHNFNNCAKQLWSYVKETDIPSICSRGISARQSDLCYWDIAARKRDLSLCSYMSDSQLKQNCGDFITQYPGRTLDK